MNKRQVIHAVLRGQKPPYVPWSFGFTLEAREKLQAHYRGRDLQDVLQNHILNLGNDYGFFTEIGNNRVRNVFGVVWNRTVDKDIGNVEGCLLPEPTIKNLRLPDPHDPRFFHDIEQKIVALSRAVSLVSNRVFAVRACLDAARHGRPQYRLSLKIPSLSASY